jgi:hypothetical protein
LPFNFFKRNTVSVLFYNNATPEFSFTPCFQQILLRIAHRLAPVLPGRRRTTRRLCCVDFVISFLQTARLSADDRRVAVLNTAFGTFLAVSGTEKCFIDSGG